MTDSAKKQTTEERWTEYADTRLKGRSIVSCRYLSKDEADGMDFHQRPLVLVLDNGTVIFPSRDDEGNDGGALFGQGGDGEQMTFPVI